MTTKFILHGGFNPGQSNEDNTDFYKEILKDAPQNAKVLLVPFAKDPDRIAISTERVTQEFNKDREGKDVLIEVASEDKFIEQIRSSDIVCFQGGASLKLLEALKNYSNLEEALSGKIIAGESAGANVLCKFFYSPRADGSFEGLGILPIKIIPHYKEEYQGKLDNLGAGLEILLLPEYTYKVFYK